MECCKRRQAPPCVLLRRLEVAGLADPKSALRLKPRACKQIFSWLFLTSNDIV